MRRKKIIRISKENMQKMMEAHHCSRVTVYNALAFRSDSDTAQIIRKQAIDIYGGVTDVVSVL